MNKTSKTWDKAGSVITKDKNSYGGIPSKHIPIAFRQLNTNEFGLLVYMFSYGGEWVFRKDDIIKALGFSDRVLEDARRGLEKKGWLYIDRGGKAITNYLIGIDTVEKHTFDRSMSYDKNGDISLHNKHIDDCEKPKSKTKTKTVNTSVQAEQVENVDLEGLV